MADPTDTPNQDAATPPAAKPPKPVAKATPRRSRWPLLATLLLLLLLAALLGGGYYFWQQLQQLRQQQAQLAPALQSRVSEMAEADAQLRDRIDTLAQEARSAQQALQELQQQQGELSEAQQALSQMVDVEVQARQGEWIRAEAAYLANVASYRLRFYGDVEGALAALKLTDQLLSRLGGAGIEGRQAVNRAIGEVVAVNAPDLDRLAGRLEELISKVDILPLDLQIREADARDAEAAQPVEPGWRGRLSRAWDRFKDTLGELVVVRRDRTVEPLLAPEERYFLYHNLRLRLEAARLALIDRNEAVYRRSLMRAAEWIERYYARGEPEVEQALATIRRLQAVVVDPELPDIAPILRPVTE